MIDRLLIGLLTGGHILLEGVPGLAKTLAVRTLAQGLRLSFQPHPVHARPAAGRRHRHADLQPAHRRVQHQEGPDLRQPASSPTRSTAPPPRCRAPCSRPCRKSRSPSATTSYPLEQPFLVLATQNPIEQEGTYPLPEAQVDRFMLKLKTHLSEQGRGAGDPRSHGRGRAGPDASSRCLSPADIFALRQAIDQIYVDDKIKRYIVDIVHATRQPADYGLDIAPYIQYGASPRATIFLTRAAKGQAFLDGRGYVTPQDVKSIGYDVLRHRIIVTYEAEAEDITSENLLQRIFDHLKVP